MSNATNNWYYAKAGQTFGPVTFEQIKQFATDGTLLSEDVVLNEDAKRWIAANTVPGLSFRSVIPPPPFVPSPPTATNQKSAHVIGWPHLQEIARWQRWLNVTVLLAITSWILDFSGVRFSGLLMLAMWIAWIPLNFLMARSLGQNPWLFVIAGFVPIVNLLAVLFLTLQATGVVRAAGFKVGLLGAQLPDQEPPNWAARANEAARVPTASAADRAK